MVASIHSYPKILNLGHRYLENLFNEEVTIEEKVDGSQFSFRRVDDTNVTYRSKGREIFLPVEDKLFKAAVDYVEGIKNELRIGWTYRGEVFCKPKHNTLLYGRIPNNHVAVFDIDTGEEKFLTYEEKQTEAERLGFETVPILYRGNVQDINKLKSLLERESFLSTEDQKTTVEGIVIKNYTRISIDGKTLMGKWVREEFKELNGTSFKNANPGNNDMIEGIVETYRHPNRWLKAVQHLKEQGLLLDEPKDIGPLMKEVSVDVLSECEQEIKERLWKYAWPKIARGITRGLPEFYKERLAEKQFGYATENTAITQDLQSEIPCQDGNVVKAKEEAVLEGATAEGAESL